ncbi:hypothetical protein [Actinotalea sp. M2MS4P-6]|uniref:hypothetical protein n=1 Tax=Actinotalea sp. M2MS4P-6 TaxID=2983762 RepID=UPI0021E40E0F|nr:hypothetical protein [Actinotalea sp. M2MS4P-6]
MLGAVGVVLVGLALLGVLVGGLAARQSARTAADLAALAAAQALAVPDGVALAPGVVLPLDAACDRAAEAASRNGAALVACSAAGAREVQVTVRRDGPFGAVVAGSRAGPRQDAAGSRAGPRQDDADP